MMSSLKSTLLVLALPILSAAQTTGGTLSAETQVQVFEGTCTAFIEIIESAEEGEKLVCESSDGMMYDVPLVDTAWIEEKRQSGELVSGATVLDLPENTMVDMQTWSLILSAPPGLLN
eukprot:CAMPEP_0113616202 /NCGR_PEP_ID=MMETSP0017_2-20120614/8114_1 /TAXON_ID=2856 /ORGANISM="Cylindrotheca closterium" /LENGTH=117 /DNA_ID=CAMNT_0000525501 /DNA_START=75 /DNA_END=428 /DNA_ORIENTATION=+ /assembly_acc=CAM_ASM_000147